MGARLAPLFEICGKVGKRSRERAELREIFASLLPRGFLFVAGQNRKRGMLVELCTLLRSRMEYRNKSAGNISRALDRCQRPLKSA